MIDRSRFRCSWPTCRRCLPVTDPPSAPRHGVPCHLTAPPPLVDTPPRAALVRPMQIAPRVRTVLFSRNLPQGRSRCPPVTHAPPSATRAPTTDGRPPRTCSRQPRIGTVLSHTHVWPFGS